MSYRDALKMIDWRKGAFGFEKQALDTATARCRLRLRRLNEKVLSISEQPISGIGRSGAALTRVIWAE